MAYRLEKADASIETAVRRIAGEQAEAALAIHAADAFPWRRSVHRMRTACKRLRALVQLVRGSFEGAGEVNELLRETAKGISGLREAAVARETLAALARACGPDVEGATAPLAAALDAEERAAVEAVAASGRLQHAAEVMRALAGGLRSWTLASDGFDAIADGLARSYRRAADALDEARRHGDAYHLHEWRKHVKAHGFHMRLLRDVHPSIAARNAMIAGMGDLLGEHHDLAAIEARLARVHEIDAGVLAALYNRVSARSKAIEAEVLEIGAVLFDAPAKARRKAWRAMYREWQER